MEIIYKDEKDFTKENIIELFLSVDWQLSASNPDKLYTALINSPTVFTAWENNKLVGLARVLDDGILTKCERKAPKFIYGDISSIKNNDSISLFFIVLYF